MNDEINKIDFVNEYIKESLPTTPVTMFLGDIWIVGEQHDNNKSVEKWMHSYESNINLAKTSKTKSIDPEHLISQGKKYIERLKLDNTFWMSFFLKPSFIYINDHKMSYKLDLKDGFTVCEKDKSYCEH